MSDRITINPAALRHIRRLTGLGVAQLGVEVGVTASYISNMEAGRRKSVSPAVFAALCRVLRVTDRRALMAETHEDRVKDWVARQLANAPPLNAEQRDLLRRVFQPAGRDDGPDAA